LCHLCAHHRLLWALDACNVVAQRRYVVLLVATTGAARAAGAPGGPRVYTYTVGRGVGELGRAGPRARVAGCERADRCPPHTYAVTTRPERTRLINRTIDS